MSEKNLFKLDTLGLICPEPVMMLHQKIRKVEVGDVIEVLADDPSTQRDIPKFCIFLGHELVANMTKNNQFIFQIKKCKSTETST